ncbi:MAG TPA: dUTP diphosphatase [Solirubrobacterales bacterium]|nr:dUTP diphosphatase [Solirubrobacterales bacterium]
MELRFRKLEPGARLPERAKPGDAGLDLRALESVRLGPGERLPVGTGLAVEIPAGYAGLVLPRSGLALRHGIGLANSPGLIDSGYRGELRVLLINHDPAEIVHLEAGDRIAQLVVVAVPECEPIEAGSLGDSERGEGGFGSTGTA